ncbi:hypothetical protein M885DRAFT_569337 [Pelagophyceae sp. CCMP2097]|nr:hypothetical protein M885DRAFT_569337 [Pelagophyceae sp. CCMP2097]
MDPEAGGSSVGPVASGGLTVEVDVEVVRQINLPKPRDATTWTVTTKDGAEFPLASAQGLLARAFGDACFVSIAQEADGQHRFVKLCDALAGVPSLQVFTEQAVKATEHDTLLYARKPNFPAAVAAAGAALWDHFDLAPRGRMSNYSIIPWVSPARTRALILTDEATLCRVLPGEKILDHVTLVINCHEDHPNLEKYTCGGGKRPQVVANAVHKWYSGPGKSIEKNDEIQKAIWDHLQNHGSVAVHCLAGIHRAAMIVVCHFLYRHYVVGDKSVSCDCDDIYSKLRAVRPAVSPAYLDIMRAYERHCKLKAHS